MIRIISTSCLFLATLVCLPVLNAQETKTAKPIVSEKEEVKVERVVLGEDGKLIGSVYALVDGEKQPLNAKMTLSADGVVIDTVKADADGNFSFANVAPGSYQMYGYADGFAGGGAVSVMPYAASQPAQDYSVGLAPYGDAGYDAYAGAPVESFGDACGGCDASTCSGAGGGGAVGRRRLLLATGAALGIVAVAGGFNGEQDASPTN